MDSLLVGVLTVVFGWGRTLLSACDRILARQWVEPCRAGVWLQFRVHSVPVAFAAGRRRKTLGRCAGIAPPVRLVPDVC